MPRKQTQDPLTLAAPGITPTARPLNITPGATQAPSRSPLMELASAFGSWDPTLRNALRDSAAQADQDAMALGELAAQKTKAAKRMGEIDGILKQEVDKGGLDFARAPAFQRGFRQRVGKELAQTGFQEALTSRLQETVRVDGRVDPETVIAESYEKFSKQIHPGDLYAREAFDATAQGIMVGFRQRSAEGYTAEYRAVALGKIADEGSELAFQLAEADGESVDTVRANLVNHMTAVRAELPSSKVNEFYVKEVIEPAVAKLISAGDLFEARQLLHEAEGMDVTGKGGLLGKTSVAKDSFAALSKRIAVEERYKTNDDLQKLKDARELSMLSGHDEAGKALLQLRLDNGGKLPAEVRYSMLDSYRKANAGDALKVQAFEQAIEAGYDFDTKNRRDPKIESDLLLGTNTIDPDKLDTVSALAEVRYQAGEISPETRTQVMEIVGKHRALSGFIDEGDFVHLKRDLYPVSRDTIGAFSTVANFDDGSGKASEAWALLTPALQEEHELQVTAFFREQLGRAIRAIGDPARVPVEKAEAVDRATVKAKEYARALVSTLSAQVRAQTAKATDTPPQTATPRLSRRLSVPAGFPFVLPGTLGPDALVPLVPSKNTTEAGLGVVEISADALRSQPTGQPPEMNPGASVGKGVNLRAELTKSGADRDYTRAEVRGVWFERLTGLAGNRVIDLNALATATKDPDPKTSEVARTAYSALKSSLGFTPEEIAKGETRHGVAFSASEIDPRRIAVFRSRTELEQHWKGGKPDEIFLSVGDAIDPQDQMKAVDFYTAQAALLTR